MSTSVNANGRPTITGDWGHAIVDEYTGRHVQAWVVTPPDQPGVDRINLGPTEDGAGEWARLRAVGSNNYSLCWIPSVDREVMAITDVGPRRCYLPATPPVITGPSSDGRGMWIDAMVPGRGVQRVFREYDQGEGSFVSNGWLNGAEACRRTGRSLSWLRGQVMAGVIRHQRFGGRDFYDEADVTDLCEGRCPSDRHRQEATRWAAEIGSAFPGSGEPSVATSQGDLPDPGEDFFDRYGK